MNGATICATIRDEGERTRAGQKTFLEKAEDGLLPSNNFQNVNLQYKFTYYYEYLF